MSAFADPAAGAASTGAREILPAAVDERLLARVAAARGAVIVADRPSFAWRRRGWLERLRRRPGQAWERVALPPVLGPREIRRVPDGAGGEIWLCSPALAANLRALLCHADSAGVGGAAGAGGDRQQAHW